MTCVSHLDLRVGSEAGLVQFDILIFVFVTKTDWKELN